MKSDPVKDQAWRVRSARAYEERRRQKARDRVAQNLGVLKRADQAGFLQHPSRQPKRRRTDSEWRADVLAAYGPGCVSCGDPLVEADHVWPRSQGGWSVVQNGLPLCGPWSRASPFQGGCHKAKTDGLLKIRYDWLTAAQRAWLAAVSWVRWDDDGVPHGRGMSHFDARGGTNE